MLRKLANSVAEKDGVVYTSVSTYKETERFGVYIAPKMNTHVFVSPLGATATGDLPSGPTQSDTSQLAININQQATARARTRTGTNTRGRTGNKLE